MRKQTSNIHKLNLRIGCEIANGLIHQIPVNKKANFSTTLEMNHITEELSKYDVLSPRGTTSNVPKVEQEKPVSPNLLHISRMIEKEKLGLNIEKQI